jgi:replicative DNA helicase
MPGDDHFPIDTGGGNRPPRDDRPRQSASRGRVPPHNIEAEESVLGALLLSREAIGVVSEMALAPADFYKPAHRHIFDAIRALYSAGAPADTVTVSDELRRAGLLAEVGGAETLHELQNATPAISSAGHYARIVQETALLRQLIYVAGDIAELAYSEPDDVVKALDLAESKVFNVAEQRVSDSTRTIEDLLPEVMDRLQETYDRGDIITGVPTGYTDLDELLSGLQESALYIVGARPAMGKCVAFDTPIVDPSTGELLTALEFMERAERAGRATLPALDGAARLTEAPVSHCLADGLKPVFRVRTRSGRSAVVTATHPLLTATGWRPVAEVAVGQQIAVPSALPIFGDTDLPDAEIDLLALLIGDGSISRSQASPQLTAALPEVVSTARQAAAWYGVELRIAGEAGQATTYRFSAGYRGGIENPVTAMLRRHDVWGCDAHHKRVPSAVMQLPRKRLARFLNRLFATDGTAWVARAGYARIGYSTVSEQLARDVSHLLLRFGVRAKLRRRSMPYRDGVRPAFEIEVMDSRSLIRFAHEIGILGKRAALDGVRAVAERATFGFSADALPVEVWDDIVKAKGELSWAEVNRRCGKPVSHNWHPYRGRVRRETVALLAAALDDDQLRWWASPDVLWDEIVEISDAGWTQVIDFTVPELHNFVAADMYLHNTAFGLGIASHVAMHTTKPVLVFSLEMAHQELTQRILASEARVDSMKIRTGKLAESDWAKIGKAIGRLEVPLFLDDNPRVTVMEIRAKARRIKARFGGIGLIVIDYLQLMGGNGSAENRQLEVSEISRNLKILARELEVPIVALSQLSRNLEARADKRPMLSDLRESGCLTASTRLVRADTNAEVTLGELVESGERDIPVWSLDEHYRLVAGNLSAAFPSGTKETFRLKLASGRWVDASANHPFLTLDGWQRLEDLVTGTRIASARRIPGAAVESNPNVDVIPAEVWEHVRYKSLPTAEMTTRQLAQRLGMQHCGSTLYKHGVSRARMRRLAEATDDPWLSDLASSDVLWDEIVAIEPLGPQPVFDATIDETHNFVANGIVAHNSLEQDADVVMFLYRDEVYHADSPDKGSAEVIVAKHRAGPIGTKRLVFLGQYTRFDNAARGV